jgi:hypothetical protein
VAGKGTPALAPVCLERAALSEDSKRDKTPLYINQARRARTAQCPRGKTPHFYQTMAIAFGLGLLAGLIATNYFGHDPEPDACE